MGSHSNPGILPRSLEVIFGFFYSKIRESSPIYKPVKVDGVQEISAEDIIRLENLKAALISKVRVPTCVGIAFARRGRLSRVREGLRSLLKFSLFPGEGTERFRAVFLREHNIRCLPELIAGQRVSAASCRVLLHLDLDLRNPKRGDHGSPQRGS